MTVGWRLAWPAFRRVGQSARHEAWPKGFTFFHDPSLPVNDGQVSNIAATLKVSEDSEHVAATLAAIRRFDGRERTMSNVDHRIRDLETLDALAVAMDGLNANVRASIERHGADLGVLGEPAQVAAAAREAATEMRRDRPPPRRGPRTRSSRNIVFRELATIYETARGRRVKYSITSGSGIAPAGKPSGPFFRFMRAAVEPVAALRALSDDALVIAVKRARKDIKAAPGR